MSAVEWGCMLTKGDSQEPLSAPITVGERVWLSCEGDESPMNWQSAKLEMPEKAKYTVQILEAKEKTATKWVGIVTSYRTGENITPEIGFTDGSNQIALRLLKFEVKSVKEKPDQQSFPWAGPLELAWPMLLWVGLALGFAALVALFIRWIIVALSWRQFLRELGVEVSPLLPARRSVLMHRASSSSSSSFGNHYQRFLRETRFMSKQLKNLNKNSPGPERIRELVGELQKQYLWFLSREFLVPAATWPWRRTVRFIKKDARKLYRTLERDLHQLNKEFESAKSNPDKVQEKDMNQLLDLCRKNVEQVYKLHSDARGDK